MNDPLTIQNHWRALFSQRDRRPIAEWAEDNITLPAVLTIRGRFDRNVSRHFVGPLEALADERVRQVTVLKPTRGGGSLIGHIWLCWTRALDPGPAMVVMQDEKEAATMAETRIMPMFMDLPGIGALLSSDRSKTRKEEILFADGQPLYVIGPAIGRLQSKGIRYLMLDEPWMYGDMVGQAKARQGDFARFALDKLLLVSQAGDEDDALDKHFKDGDRCEFEVPCLGCGKRFDARWSGERDDGSRWGMRWDDHRDAREFWLVKRCLPTVRYECPACGHHHLDSAGVREIWKQRGEWVPHNSEAVPSKRSFHWRAILDSPWADLAQHFMGASNALKVGVAQPMVEFFQQRMAEPRSAGSLFADSLEFKRLPYDIKSDWPDEYIRYLTADRQTDELFWVMVRAWSRRGESRTLYYGSVYGFSEVKRLQEEFKCTVVGMDSGHLPKGDHGVYAACIRYTDGKGRWIAMRGDGRKDSFSHHFKGRIVQRSYSEPLAVDPEVSRAPGSTHKRFANRIDFAAGIISDRVRGLIKRGLWIEPQGKPNDSAVLEYRTQMSAEFKRVTRDPVTGKRREDWVCPSGNNHAFDCAKMQTCLATAAKLLPDTALDDVQADAEEVKTT